MVVLMKCIVIPVLAAELDKDGLQDGDHHGCGGGVGDPHGEDGGGQHESKQHTSGGTAHHQQNLEPHASLSESSSYEVQLEDNDSPVDVRVLDSYGHHEPSHEKHARGLEVVNTYLGGGNAHWSQHILFQIYLSCGHDAEEGEEHHRDEGGGRDGQEIQQPDGGVRDVQVMTNEDTDQ